MCKMRTKPVTAARDLIGLATALAEIASPETVPARPLAHAVCVDRVSCVAPRSAHAHSP